MFNLRLIQSKDNPSIAQIIRTVSQEFGLASDAGFAVSDPILDDLYQVYQEPNSRYWVVESTQGKIVGRWWYCTATGRYFNSGNPENVFSS